MLYTKKGMPEEGECVFCTVTKIHFHSVFVTLDEYQNKQGMIHISEISPGRIRNINEFVKEGKVIVCKVLNINKERGHIDLSLRRVNESQRRAKIEERKQQTIAENIIVSYADLKKEKPEVVFESISKILLKTYESLYAAFEDVVESDASLEKAGLDKETATPLEKVIRERIKIKEVIINASATIHSYESDGIELIHQVLDKAMNLSEKLSIKYAGAGNYDINIVTQEFEEAEKIFADLSEILTKGFEKTNSTVEIKRKK
ncbi:MAG: S1 RNA-binding domain-containing protein [Candidatus Nanoarchaeia archaeon]|nr:S1 RNA-binding domain-containing protein [Candidatus Nanoarchaeia archaeon]